MYRGLRRFRGDSKVSTWLYKIVTNHCLMESRRRKIDQLLESYDEPSPAGHEGHVPRWEETPADVLLKKEFQTMLDNAIQKLPMEYRVVFVLRDLEGRSTEETARIAGISQEAAKSRVRRARAFLREQLSPYLEIEE
jgi:RNA polymerase sigma-70 factor, ECF subfamily